MEDDPPSRAVAGLGHRTNSPRLAQPAQSASHETPVRAQLNMALSHNTYTAFASHHDALLVPQRHRNRDLAVFQARLASTSKNDMKVEVELNIREGMTSEKARVQPIGLGRHKHAISQIVLETQCLFEITKTLCCRCRCCGCCRKSISRRAENGSTSALHNYCWAGSHYITHAHVPCMICFCW